MGRTYSTHRRDNNACKILVDKLEGKRAAGRRRLGLEGVVVIVPEEMGRGTVDCLHLTQDGSQWLAFVSTVTNFREAGDFFTR